MAVTVSLFIGIASQLKTAADIAVGLGKLHTMAEVNAKAIELQTAILGLQSDAFTAQAQQSAMVQQIRDLEEKLARVEAWEETKKRYQMVTPWPGATVYALKRESAGTDPPHLICTTCYEDRRKSILNARAGNNGFWMHFC